MNILSDKEIIKSINDGRQGNKRDGRDGVLVAASPEYMRDHKYSCQVQHLDTLRQVRKLLNGIENPCEEIIQAMSAPEDSCENKEWRGFNRAIQAMKTLLEENE